MAVSTITYTNKVALNENPSVADINKVKADDMNEIKTVVNNNATYISKNTTDIANITGTILWTNPNPTSSFTGQTLSVDLSDYDSYEIIYVQQGNASTLLHLTTGRIPKGKGTYMMRPSAYFSGREVTASSDSGITFGGGYYLNSYGNTSRTTENIFCVPLYVIGYKTGLFD